jgi:hypothetical protein
MVQRSLLALYFYLALYLGFSVDLVNGIPTSRSYSKLVHQKQRKGLSLRLVGGSSKITTAEDIQAFAPFDEPCLQGLKPLAQKSSLHGSKLKKKSDSGDYMRTPRPAGSKAVKDELFSPLFQTPQKQHSIEFAGYIEIFSDQLLHFFINLQLNRMLPDSTFDSAGLHQELGSARWKPRFRLAR